MHNFYLVKAEMQIHVHSDLILNKRLIKNCHYTKSLISQTIRAADMQIHTTTSILLHNLCSTLSYKIFQLQRMNPPDMFLDSYS